MAIHEQQDAAVEITEANAASSQKIVVPVVGNIEALHACQNIGERPIAVTFDFFRGDDRCGGRRFSGFLFKF